MVVFLAGLAAGLPGQQYIRPVYAAVEFSPFAGTPDPTIRVGILVDQSQVTVSGEAAFEVDVDSGRVFVYGEPKDQVSITAMPEGLSVNGAVVAGSVIVKIVNEDGEHGVKVGKRSYRGFLEIRPNPRKQTFNVINVLSVEQYLYGVIAREISPDWPLEAVKAQAVAARTYALAGFNKHKDEGFDVCATTHCQVYGGKDSERPRAILAVDATHGEVLYYHGRLIEAYFHSSSGGYTENSENVWGIKRPYLRGVPDFDQESPYFHWEKMFPVSALSEILNRNGYKIGQLRSIELSPLGSPPMNLPDRGVSGRVRALRLSGTSGALQINGTALRTLLGLNSTLFDVKVKGKEGKEDKEDKGDKGDGDKGGEVRKILLSDQDTVLFYGFGSGHGVGLSQWGAKAMAEKAPPGDNSYYIRILKYYYTGVDVERAY